MGAGGGGRHLPSGMRSHYTPPGASPWSINPEDFPEEAEPEAQLAFLARYAILAPSSHNTQPWIFLILGNRLDLLADRTRALPVVDPFDRALVISCGAALANLELAADHFGINAEVGNLASRENDLLARVYIGGHHPPGPRETDLFEAITRRHTNRRPFAPEPPPRDLLERAEALAESRDCRWYFVTDGALKSTIANLVAEGDRIQMANPSFRRELASWIHSRRSASRDGLSGYAMGMPDALSAAGALAIRTFDMGKGQAARDMALATGSPVLAVLTTRGDTPTEWLDAGRALQLSLLAVTAAGFAASFLNQPIEVDALRMRLAEAIGTPWHPHIILRIGRGEPIEPAMRRPLEEVLIHE